MTPGAPPSRKNADIEILRAFAILYTLVLHLRVLLPPDSALLVPLTYLDLSIGVDLFLVISGFVITGSLLESSERSSAGRRPLMFSFWIKRIFRLLPAAWTWVAIACVAQLLLITTTDIPYQLEDIFLTTAAALANVMNFYTPHCVAGGGGLPCIIGNYVGHYWSLSLEEQFYLVFPFLFFFLGRRALACFLIAAILAQAMWQRPFFTYAWYFKTDALCWGILLALLARTAFYHKHVPVIFRQRYVPQVCGFILLAALPYLAANIQGIGGYMKPYGVALVALVCAIIVWLASYDRDAFSIGNRYRRVMLYLGSRSYSLYLCHFVIYLIVQALFELFGEDLTAVLGSTGYYAVLVAAACGLTLAAAELTYTRVEIVLRARGRGIADKLLAKAGSSR